MGERQAHFGVRRLWRAGGPAASFRKYPWQAADGGRAIRDAIGEGAFECLSRWQGPRQGMETVRYRRMQASGSLSNVWWIVLQIIKNKIRDNILNKNHNMRIRH